MSVTAEVSTFLVADLAGYTALTEAHGDRHAADVAAEFCRLVRDELEAFGAEEVNAFGDGMLLRLAGPAAAVRLAGSLLLAVVERGHPLGIRIGLHTGTAVHRDGDWFGSAVNIASRVATVGASGQAVMTAATHDAARLALADYEVRQLGPRRLKHLREPLQLYAMWPRGTGTGDEGAVDPVCRMRVAHELVELSMTLAGRQYRFCSIACRDAFAAAPELFSSVGVADVSDA